MLLSRRALLGAIGTLPLVRVARGQAMHRLTILHYNDVHSRHEPVDDRLISCTAGANCFGSTPRLATAIREQRDAARADGRTVVVLDGGDQFQGSLFYTVNHGRTELAVQNAIGIDAMTLGNHEFDNGPETLGPYISGAQFPVVCANIDVSAEPLLAGKVRPFTIIERDGFKLGVVGLLTLETQHSSSPGPNVRFMDPRTVAPQAVAAARAAGADAVVLLSHLGLPYDRTLNVPGVAAIVGAHSHTLLSNTEPSAQGPCPTLADAGLPVVQAGAYARFLGRLDLDLDAGGTVLALAAGCRHIGLDLLPDPAVAAIVARFAAPLEAEMTRVVAVLPHALGIAACRVAPCEMGEIVATALRSATHGEAIGMTNAGGLRVGLPAGPVTRANILETMPFGNSMATLTLTGADLVAVAKQGLNNAGRGSFVQWSGLRVVPFPAAIEVQAADGRWSAIDPAAKYRIATNNFLRSGGDGFAILQKDAIDPYDNGPLVVDLFTDALVRTSPP